MTFPVIVDPEEPMIQPPVIAGVSTWCQGSFDEGQVRVIVQNVDPYHYSAPFQATYDWTLTNDSSTLTSGTFGLAAWETQIIGLSTTTVGTFTFTVTDIDLGGSATAEVDVPDCVNAPPPPVGDPLPPTILVAAVSCSEDYGPDDGTGDFRFYVYNPGGADGSPRDYDYDVQWEQVSINSGLTSTAFDGGWTDGVGTFVHSGTFMVIVADHDDPSLTAAASVEVPECPPPPPPSDEPAPPNPPVFINVAMTCADPVLLDGRVDFVVLNPNWLFLGGPGELTYDWTLTDGTSTVESFEGYFAPRRDPVLQGSTPAR